MIEVDGLSKRYGDVLAVKDLSFSATRGRIFGLLGPNGAGKSTTIQCLVGLVRPTAGSLRILGHDLDAEPRAARERLGYVPQSLALYEDLSARENLRYFGGTYGLRGAALRDRVEEVLDTIGLRERAAEPVKRFSGGMKRRLNFGAGIVHRPEVLLLDEPTVGVDPQSRVRLLDLVRAARDGGTCVLYTTHYMEEAEALCDRIGIIDHGHLVAEGTLDELRARLGERDVLRLEGRFDPVAVREALEREEDLVVEAAEEDGVRLAARGASSRLPRLLDAVERSGAELRSVVLTQPSLESLFIALTGRELRE